MIRKSTYSCVLLFVLFASLAAVAQSTEVYFSLSSDRTYRPDQKPKVNLYAHNVDYLEFRVYRVQDPAAFFTKLDDLHEFGVRHYSPREQVDQRTWLEKFHDWKISWWRWIRDFFRGQYSGESRAKIRDWHSGKAKRSATRGAVGFADVPLLNSQQLVARWKMELPPKYVSESSELPIENLKPGLYVVEATDGTYRAFTVLVVSEMALVTKTAPGQIVAFTVERKTGRPAGNVRITVWNKHQQLAAFSTGTDGMGEAPIELKNAPNGDEDFGDSESGYGSNWVLAQHGEDVAIVAPYSLNLSSNPREDWAGYAYTDRPVYRPGHTVHFKAILRKRTGERLLLPTERQAEVTVEDSANNTVLKKTYPLSTFGSLNGSLEIPQSAPLGYYTISVVVGESRIGSSFEIQEYKKPEYFVKVTPERNRVLQGENVKATIEARYYFGEPVTNAKVKYVVHTQRAWFSDDDDSTDTSDGSEDADRYFYGEQVLEQEGKLDGNGRLVVTIPTSVQEKQKVDVEYRVEARVTDAVGREVAGHNGVLATYGSYRLNSSTGSYIYRVGESVPVVVHAQDYEKHAVQADLKIALLRHKYGEQDVQIYSGTEKTGADGYARFNVPASESGSMVLRVTSKTPEGREVEAQSWMWIVGKGESTYGEEGNEQQLQVLTDKSSYKVGDVARIVVMGGVENATVFVTTEGRTVMTRRIVKADGQNATFEVPITEQSQPNFYVSAFVVADDTFYKGSKNIKVPPVERTLKIDVTPSKQQFQPGEPAAYDVRVTDNSGTPVKAELSLGVVDDAIYAVRPDSSGNIVNAFYEERYGIVQTEQSFSFYFHGEAGKKPIPIAMRGVPGGLARGALAQVKDLVQPKVRKAFPDTAFWAAEIRTDDNGRATARLAFPDSLTTWRTTVRAVTMDTKAGAAINKVLVRKNLMVRLAAPRFFRQGDEVTVSTIVHNYLASAKTVRISLDVTGVDMVAGTTQQVEVPQRGEVKLDWRLRTKPGQTSAKLLAKALTNEESDAMELTLPVIPFGVKQGVAAGGTQSDATGSSSTNLSFPAGVDPGSRSIQLEASPSLAGAIFSSLEYLTSFPYGCTEQTMSSFLPNVVVASTLKELKVPSRVDPALLARQVDAGFERLYDFQHEDGGWGWWKEDDSMLFMTAYVVSGMAQAQSAGYSVRPDAFLNGKNYLKKALAEHPNMIPDLRAYVAYSLALAGERDHEALDKLWNERSKLSSEGIAMAGLVMHLNGDDRANEAANTLRSMVKAEGEGAYWASSKDDLLEIDVDNSAEATAYAVKLLSQLSPQDMLLPKAVLWMMRHRNEGHWYSTKQTAMVLFGITEYLKVSKELDASFNVEILVNGKQVLGRRFTQQDATSGLAATALVSPAAVGENNRIEVRKNGSGSLYWSARGVYYSRDKSLNNKNGLKLSIVREYFKMTSEKSGEKIVYTLAPLSGPVQTGDLLAIKITVTGDKWKYLMVEDPIPAGTEFVERDELYELRQKPSWWRNWYSRREFHDDRAVMFQTWFTNGVREYFYLVKVTNAGMFQISPASVQPMYQPDVLSTTDPAVVEVK
ncbi:MAG TPA: alpha-2-macroglobulin family protein [Clostridia bacterium]|nr:alpha-2-macroglobulin family protein [Clostridia bacterium]